MLSPLTYHSKIKNEQHIFIYCVGGRSSSTTFQRIINSSNLVWIWGENHHMIDDTVALINHLKNYSKNILVTDSLEKLYNSFVNNKHLSFYPNAIGNLDATAEIISSAISNLLKPWATKIKRFGFKEIAINDIQTLNYLTETYPQSYTLFGFRDPLTQWPSILNLKDWWDYGADVKLFLEDYYRISGIYIEFASTVNKAFFVENNDLRDIEKVAKIIKHLRIPQIDNSLIDVTVEPSNPPPLADNDKELIVKSGAYQNYLKMKELSESFYQSA